MLQIDVFDNEFGVDLCLERFIRNVHYSKTFCRHREEAVRDVRRSDLIVKARLLRAALQPC
jgi:hypothetical protein